MSERRWGRPSGKGDNGAVAGGHMEGILGNEGDWVDKIGADGVKNAKDSGVGCGRVETKGRNDGERGGEGGSSYLRGARMGEFLATEGSEDTELEVTGVMSLAAGTGGDGESDRAARASGRVCGRGIRSRCAGQGLTTENSETLAQHGRNQNLRPKSPPPSASRTPPPAGDIKP